MGRPVPGVAGERGRCGGDGSIRPRRTHGEACESVGLREGCALLRWIGATRVRSGVRMRAVRVQALWVDTQLLLIPHCSELLLLLLLVSEG